MKRNHFKLLLVIVLMILACVFNIFVAKIFTERNTIFIIFWLSILGILLLSMGLEKNRSIYALDVIQIVFIFCIIYLIATYMFGFFFGFIKSPYSLRLVKILENIIPIIIVVILQELVRFEFVSKGKGKKFLIIMLIMIFIAFDISLALGWFIFGDSMSLFEFIGTIILKSIAQNLILTYISSKVGYKTPIMYRLIFEVTTYIIPIYPDLGLYLESLLEVIFPVALFLKLNTFFATFKQIPRKARVVKFKRFLILIPTYASIVIIFILISGLFKFYAMAIVSNSMAPVIYRGDMVIVQKLNDQEIEKLEVGTTLAYFFENRVITHRIVAIEEHKKSRVFYTKGDNNEDVDNWEITKEMIKGKVEFKIPYIGYPSVWLYEIMK